VKDFYSRRIYGIKILHDPKACCRRVSFSQSLVIEVHRTLGGEHLDTLGVKAVLRKIVKDRAATGWGRGKVKGKDERGGVRFLRRWFSGSESLGTAGVFYRFYMEVFRFRNWGVIRSFYFWGGHSRTGIRNVRV